MLVAMLGFTACSDDDDNAEAPVVEPQLTGLVWQIEQVSPAVPMVMDSAKLVSPNLEGSTLTLHAGGKASLSIPAFVPEITYIAWSGKDDVLTLNVVDVDEWTETVYKEDVSMSGALAYNNPESGIATWTCALTRKEYKDSQETGTTTANVTITMRRIN